MKILKIKMQAFAVKTLLHYIINQLHVAAAVSRHHKVDPKNAKRKKHSCTTWSELSDISVCYIKYIRCTICMYEELYNGG